MACVWPLNIKMGGVNGGFLEEAFFHDRNVGIGIRAGIGGGFGATFLAKRGHLFGDRLGMA